MKYKWSIGYDFSSDSWSLAITRLIEREGYDFDELLVRRSYALKSDAEQGLLLIRSKIKAAQNGETGEFEA